MTVPADNSCLNPSLEELLNQSDLVEKVCEDGCQKVVQAEKRTQLTCGEDTRFLIVVLTIAGVTAEGFHILSRKNTSTHEVFVR